jgi:hypothetical protein
MAGIFKAAKNLRLCGALGGALITSGCTNHMSESAEASSATGCLERRTAIGATQTTPVGVSADQALAWLGVRRSGTLTWKDGSNAPPTEISFVFSERRAYLVHSQPDPDAEIDIGVHCEDHVEVEARMNVSTADGKLLLDKDKVRLTAEASTGYVLGVIGNIDPDDLRGSYNPARINECFVGTQLNVWFSSDAFNGTLLDSIAFTSCSTLNGLSGVSPRDGAEW